MALESSLSSNAKRCGIDRTFWGWEPRYIVTPDNALCLTDAERLRATLEEARDSEGGSGLVASEDFFDEVDRIELDRDTRFGTPE